MHADRIFVVASGLDDSIKRFCPSYELILFPNFTEFEQYIESTPDVVHSIIVAETVLPFTGTNMKRLLDIIQNPFITLQARVIYLYSETTSKAAVKQWTDTLDGFPVVAYQGDLTDQYIIGIINGKLRDSDEEKVEEVTYRMRASEYIQEQKIKKYETSNDEHYQNDDDELAGIPDVEEPEIYTPTTTEPMKVYPLVGFPTQARTTLAFVEAQYLALTAKTLIIESDPVYHRLTDMALKSDIKFMYIDVNEIHTNVSDAINRIKTSKDNLIIVGSKGDTKYSYSFIKMLLVDNLSDYVQNVVVECDFADTPYMQNYSIVFDDTMPDLLETVRNMIYPIDETKNVFVGVRQNSWQPINMTTQELTDVICDLFNIKDVVAQTITLRGTTLKKENSVYDLFSIIGRGNRR